MRGLAILVLDDPRKQSNVRGTVAFAFAVPNGRTTQVYIALSDLSATQDEQGFVPIGRVVSGMEVADALNSEYGENSGSGIRAGKQQPLFDGGNAYLDHEYLRLDRILQARIVAPAAMPARKRAARSGLASASGGRVPRRRSVLDTREHDGASVSASGGGAPRGSKR